MKGSVRWVLKTAVILLFWCSFLTNVTAQYQDAGLWVSVNAEKKIASRTTLNIAIESRLKENLSQAGTFFAEAGIVYKWKKYFSTGFFYRFIEKRNLDATYSTRHRFFTDISGRIKVKSFTISLRERIQSQVQDYYSSETGSVPDWYLRSKLTVKMEVSRRITPFVSLELFYQLSNAEGNEFDNIRYAAGFEYSFNRRHAMEPFYMIQKEFHVNNPVTDFVTGLSYKITF